MRSSDEPGGSIRGGSKMNGEVFVIANNDKARPESPAKPYTVDDALEYIGKKKVKYIQNRR